MEKLPGCQKPGMAVWKYVDSSIQHARYPATGLLPSTDALYLVTPSHDQSIWQLPDVTRFCLTELGSNQLTFFFFLEGGG